MKDLIIQATVPVITGNFEVVKQQMLEGVKQYDVIITTDTVKDGKAMATELNKMKSMIKEVQKKHLDELTGPIAEFKDQIKELVDIAESARQKILDQVKVFEDQQRELHLAAMTDYLKEQIEEQQLTEEFSAHLHCKDFVSITGLATKGSLTKKSRDQIDLIISRALQLQTEAKLEAERKQREEDIRVENRARELARTEKIETSIANIKNAPLNHLNSNSETLKSVIESFYMPREEEFHEFYNEAVEAYNATMMQLKSAYETKVEAEQAKTPEPEPEPHPQPKDFNGNDRGTAKSRGWHKGEPEQNDTFGIVDDVIPEQRDQVPEQQSQPEYEQPSFAQEHHIEMVGVKVEFIAEVKILLRAPANMPKQAMAQAVFRTLEAQGVTDIQDVTIL